MRSQGQGRLVFGRCTDARACRDGESPVDIAASEGHSDCVAALVRAGAPPPEQQLSSDED
jgi:hypothetical protein